MQFSETVDACSHNLNQSKTKQIKGQFGFNPNSLKLLSSKIANVNNNNTSLNSKLASCSFKFTSNVTKEKKSVKRLSNTSKFSIDTMSKKHQDCEPFLNYLAFHNFIINLYFNSQS